MNRVTVIPVAPTERPAADAAMSWPSARVRIEGGNPPFRVQLYGEPYNTGERIALLERNEGGDTTFGPIRPGQYSLNISDSQGAMHRRSIVVPPGGKHDVTIDAPNWQPQPTHVQIELDLPESLPEDLEFIAVLELSPSVASSSEEWKENGFFICVDSRGRVAQVDRINNVFNLARMRRSQDFHYQFFPGAVDFKEHIILDASKRYTIGTVSVYFRRATTEENRYANTRLDQELVIEPQMISSGRLHLPMHGLTESIDRMVPFEDHRAPAQRGGDHGGGGPVGRSEE